MAITRNPSAGEINVKLTDDKIVATRIRQNDGFTTLVVNTWEQALNNEKELPPNWLNHSEVLVGRTASALKPSSACFEPHTIFPPIGRCA
jgi:hypothetical protein